MSKEHMMEFERLELEQVSGHYDEASGILFVTYRGSITSDTTAKVYAWISRLIENGNGVNTTRGSIFDFRDVTEFALGNLTTAQNRSESLNTKVDISNHPVALLVDTLYQRMMVKTSMYVTPQQKRKHMVETMDAALNFINTWHQQPIPEQQ
jgi:hypothetical protein